MKIVQVIHGYPMRYNAGSEVYTQTLCRALVAHHEVHVFTREEDPFAPDASVRTEVDRDDARIRLHLVNNPRSRDRYRDERIDRRFAELLDRVVPDVVHIGHLSHLSTSLVEAAASREIPIVFTLHDYWVMCPRGQFMQTHPVDPADLWAACDGQEDRKCAERCYAHEFSGAPDEHALDVSRWQDWVARRMRHVREMVELVDLFIAPSRYLLRRYRDDFGIPHAKLVYLDYGFDRSRLQGRKRRQGEPFTFGYIGTHIPAKGIAQLLEAFGHLRGAPYLRIWGRPRGQETGALKAIASRLPGDASARIEWRDEYRNEDIVSAVFDDVDAIVVPSVWVENSPLVIHEALQARVPVITANVGGMAEYVEHEVNGLLFEHRQPGSLATQMQRLVDDPALGVRMGERGYVWSESGDVPDVTEHATRVVELYERAIARRTAARVDKLAGPWRLTFDTNPDTCNLHCVMCEEHSPHSPLQLLRKQAGSPRRVMPLALLRRVVEDASTRGLKEIIPSTMGEPLLFEGLEEILALCRDYGVKLNLTTNGTFPRHGARGWAERLVPVTSDVKISWNGATKETYESVMLGGRWEAALENVRVFIAERDAHAAQGGNRCRVTFQLTFLETNVGELAAMVRLAIDLGVDRVKGHHLWAHFKEIESLSMRRDVDARRRWNEAVLAARAAAAERTLPNGRHVLLENIFLLDEESPGDLAPGGACPFLGRELWVSAEGRFNPCCAPDAQRRTLGELGNLEESSLSAIWNGPDYARLLRTYSTRHLCLGCNMRRPS